MSLLACAVCSGAHYSGSSEVLVQHPLLAALWRSAQQANLHSMQSVVSMHTCCRMPQDAACLPHHAVEPCSRPTHGCEQPHSLIRELCAVPGADWPSCRKQHLDDGVSRALHPALACLPRRWQQQQQQRQQQQQQQQPDRELTESSLGTAAQFPTKAASRPLTWCSRWRNSGASACVTRSEKWVTTSVLGHLPPLELRKSTRAADSSPALTVCIHSHASTLQEGLYPAQDHSQHWSALLLACQSAVSARPSRGNYDKRAAGGLHQTAAPLYAALQSGC